VTGSYFDRLGMTSVTLSLSKGRWAGYVAIGSGVPVIIDESCLWWLAPAPAA
jgi:hypothetical protein